MKYYDPIDIYHLYSINLAKLERHTRDKKPKLHQTYLMASIVWLPQMFKQKLGPRLVAFFIDLR